MAIKHVDTSSIQFKYATLCWGSIITAVVTIVFIVLAKSFGLHFEVRDIVALITCGLVSTTLVYNAKNLELNYEINQAKINFDIEKYEEDKISRAKEKLQEKCLHSFNVSSLWFRPEMANNVELSRQFIRLHKDKLTDGIPINVFMKLMEDNTEERKAVMCILNYFENISLLIKKDLADEECIKLCFKTLFVDYATSLRKYIDEVQIEKKTYLMNYEEIAGKWAKM